MLPSRLNFLSPGCLCHLEAWLAETGCGSGKLWKDLLLSSYCMYLIRLIFLCSLLLPAFTVWLENGVGWYFIPFPQLSFMDL